MGQPVSGVEVLESHPVRVAPGHQVDRLEYLEGAQLLYDDPSPELCTGVLLVGSEAADKVGLSMHQGPRGAGNGYVIAISPN